MFVVGLTGGIGSGKTTVSNYFAELGIEIVDTDIIARKIVEPKTPCLAKIAEHYGTEILLPDGTLDRKKLREIIFSQPLEKDWLESLMHPVIRRSIVEAFEHSQSAYTILATPLLFETRDTELVTRTLIIDVPPSLQVSRVTARDKVSEEQTRKITASQIDREKRLELADDIIDNSGTIEYAKQQALALHNKYLSMAKR